MELINGDCLRIIPKLKDRSINLVLVDVPYGTTNSKWDTVIPLERYIKTKKGKIVYKNEFLLYQFKLGKQWEGSVEMFDELSTPGLWDVLSPKIHENTAILMTCSQPFTTSLIKTNPKMFRYMWVWEKTTPTGFLNANRMPMKCHETVAVFYSKLPKYNPQKTHGHVRKTSSAHNKRNSKKSEIYHQHDLKGYDSTVRYPRDVIKFSNDKQKISIHSVQKPLALMEYFINTYSDVGDVVLDFAMGSGTTGVACQNLNRGFVGIEIEKDTYEVAIKRINSGAKR